MLMIEEVGVEGRRENDSLRLYQTGIVKPEAEQQPNICPFSDGKQRIPKGWIMLAMAGRILPSGNSLLRA